MFAAHAFWMGVGVVSLIVAGPVYVYELELLGQAPLVGANIAAPLALACFARVAPLPAPTPFPPHPSRGRKAPAQAPAPAPIVLADRRPKTARRTPDQEPPPGDRKTAG